MQTISDFFSFKAFISPGVLLTCYPLGAIGIPIMLWILVILARQKAHEHGLVLEKSTLWTRWATHPNQIVVAALFILMFLCMEIGWRMMFEFMLAYFQMRDALMSLT